MNSKKGLLVSVLRNARSVDFTLGGLTSMFSELILFGDDVEGVFESRDETPAVILEIRNIMGSNYVRALPCDHEGNVFSGQWAFGGNFIYTSDSRFPSKQPIPVHDRDLNKERH